MHTILLIDDDVELCQMLQEYLRTEGFEAEAAHDGETGAQRAIDHDYALVILDVMLPRLNGFEALRRIRADRPVPILMLTARGDEIDRIVGLEMGADDYLPKPFNPRELVARLRAILRRGDSVVSLNPHSVPLRQGTLEVHPATRSVMLAGKGLNLTSTEYNLCECLVRNAGSVVAKETLYEQGLGRKMERFDRSIDVHIANLRRKLGHTPDGHERIQTVRGIGYQLIVE